jgi:hypothetical protein
MFLNTGKVLHQYNRQLNLKHKNLRKCKLSRHGEPIGSRQTCYKCKKTKELINEEGQ